MIIHNTNTVGIGDVDWEPEECPNSATRQRRSQMKTFVALHQARAYTVDSESKDIETFKQELREMYPSLIGKQVTIVVLEKSSEPTTVKLVTL